MKPAHQTTITICAYTTFNSNTDKINLAIVGTDGKVSSNVIENCGKQYLLKTLSLIDTLADSVVRYADDGGFSSITINLYRFRDNNLGHCLSKIETTLRKLRVVQDKDKESFINGVLRKHNGSKMKSYDVMKSIIGKLDSVQSKCQLTFYHEIRKDDITDIAWQTIKV